MCSLKDRLLPIPGLTLLFYLSPSAGVLQYDHEVPDLKGFQSAEYLSPYLYPGGGAVRHLGVEGKPVDMPKLQSCEG